MSSLNQHKTILGFLGIHQMLSCQRCGGFVDCVILTAHPQYRDGRIWFARDTKNRICPDCQIREACGDNQAQLQAQFEAMRKLRIELGLGTENADQLVREVLQMRGVRTTTLWIQSVHPNPRKPPENGATSPSVARAEVLMVLGDGSGLPIGKDAYRDFDIARFPAIGLYPPDPQARFPGVVFVALGANVWRPNMPGVEVQLRWNPANPMRYEMNVDGWELAKPGQLGALVSDASTVFSRWVDEGSGRPRIPDRDLDYYYRAYREQRSTRGLPVRQKDFINDLRFAESKRGNKKLLNRTTLKRNLEQHALWPYERFQDWAEERLATS